MLEVIGEAGEDISAGEEAGGGYGDRRLWRRPEEAVGGRRNL